MDNETHFVKSQFIQKVESGDLAIVWHSLFGKPKFVSDGILKLLNFFSKPRTFGSFFSGYRLNKNDKSHIYCLNTLIKNYYLVPEGHDERTLLKERQEKYRRYINNGSLVKYLELIISEECNFRCTFCIHFNNLTTSNRLKNHRKMMTFKVAKRAIDHFLKILFRHNRKTAKINFGGGEPLLGWPMIERILKYCRSTYERRFKFHFSINTNASLITNEVARKLKRYNVEVASSLDGFRKGNDQVRLTKSGRGTFDFIIKGFDCLAKLSYPLNGIAVTATDRNFSHINKKFIDWAAKRKMKDVRIDIDVIGMIKIPLKKIVRKLIGIRSYAKKYGINVSGFWSRPVENLNESAFDTQIAFCGAVRGNSLCVNPVGDIYSCGYSINKLGSLNQMDSFFSSQERYSHFVYSNFIGSLKTCQGCMIEGQCGGGCRITYEFEHATKAPKTRQMCDFYRQMTKELLFEQLQEFKLMQKERSKKMSSQKR